MGILYTIVIGFVAGVLARFLIPGPTPPKSLIMTTVLGMIGAILASYVCQAMGWANVGDPVGLIGAVLGAIVVLLVYGKLRKK